MKTVEQNKSDTL